MPCRGGLIGPLGFSQISKTVTPLLAHMFIRSSTHVKISDPGLSRSGHQVTSSENFDFGDTRSGQFCDLSIISQWEKSERRLFWRKTTCNTLKHQITGRLDTLSWNIATNDPWPCRLGHFQFMKGHQQFFGNKFREISAEVMIDENIIGVFKPTIRIN